MSAFWLKIALMNLVEHWHSRNNLCFTTKENIYIYICEGVSDPEHDEQELKIQDLNEKILK